MINNRQAGRRRGRNGGGGGGGNNNGPRQGRSDNGNRIDNRSRGNAAQLLEKYRNLASDAQRQGDRVNTEYYLQFADHYFRVLSDQRGRFEDQQPRRQRDEFEIDGDDDFADEGDPIRPGEQQMEVRRERADRPERQERSERPERQERSDRPERQERSDRRPRAARDEQRSDERMTPPAAIGGQHRADPVEAGEPVAARAEAVIEADAPLAPPRRRGRPRKVVADEAGGAAAEPSFGEDRLPPSLNPANDAAAGEDRPRRRRIRTPTSETTDAAE